MKFIHGPVLTPDSTAQTSAVEWGVKTGVGVGVGLRSRKISFVGVSWSRGLTSVSINRCVLSESESQSQSIFRTGVGVGVGSQEWIQGASWI